MDQPQLIELIATLQPHQTLIVEAEGGAGKTWAAMDALRSFSANARVAVLAPTHIALNELKAKLPPDLACVPRFATTASFVGRYLERNRQTGKLDNRFMATSCDVDLIILDEAANAPSIDISRVLRSASPIVCLGDREQLKAVLSTVSALWNEDAQWRFLEVGRSFTYVTLEGQRRNAGEILKLAQACRTKLPSVIESKGAISVFHSTVDFEADFLANLQSARANCGSLNAYCYLAYKNATVDRVQRLVRQFVYGSDLPVVGEPVRVNRLVNQATGDRLPTGKLLTVASVEATNVAVAGATHAVAKLTFAEIDGSHFCAFPGGATETIYAALRMASEERRWDDFNTIEHTVGEVVNGNVLTVHKAQGRTIPYCWSDDLDIGNRRSMRYVAYSRASERLALVAHRPKPDSDLWMFTDY